MASEIAQEKEQEPITCIIDAEAQELKIRRIINYQKSLYSSSSSSFSSAGASCSSFSSPRKSNSLLDLMKVGNTSLRRLFDMEHTSLEDYFKDYSGSPVIKPILLWGSDTDDDDDGVDHHDDPWMSIKTARAMVDYRSDGQNGMASDDNITNIKSHHHNKLPRLGRRRLLTRTKSFRRLPRYRRFWKSGGFRFRLRLLRRLRIILCGRKF